MKPSPASPLKPQHLAAASHRQRGLTLLETLIAIVVMALAILGVLAMQMKVLSENRNSVYRAQAIRLIENLAEQIQLNPNSISGDVAQAYDLVNFSASTPSQQPCGNVNAATGCTSVQQAQDTIARWRRDVQRTLPGGQAALFFVSSEGDSGPANRRQLAVMVAWSYTGSGSYNRGAADTDLDKQTFHTVSTVADGRRRMQCPPGSFCHLDYIPLTGRCVPNESSGRMRYFCPDGSFKRL